MPELALTHPHSGYRQLGALLRREGWAVNRQRVLRLTRQDHPLSLRRNALVLATTDPRHTWRPYPHWARRLVVSGVNQPWVADLTYIRLQEQFVSFSVMLDASSRRVVGWALADR